MTQNAQLFAFIGVDFIGTLRVQDRGNQNKVYVYLFTYAITRTVCLVLVTKLSVETFMQDLEGSVNLNKSLNLR